MRPARMLLGTALALALAWPARGDTTPAPALVQTDGAEVRCKPGAEPAVYVTQALKRGDAVEVVEQLPGGWLKIVPPQGSYSWVNTRFLRAPAPPATQPVWVVVIDKDAKVPVLVGSPLKSGKPDVVGTQLERGSQVTAVGDPRAAEDGDGLWLPIMPPPGEYRYVRARDVALTPPGPAVTTTTTAAHSGSAAPAARDSGPPSPAGPPDAARPPEVRVGAPVTAADTDPLLQQAEQKERAGDRAEAARLYDQLGNKYYYTRSDVAQQCYSRAAWLRSEVRPAAPATEGDALYAQARQYEQAGNWSEAARVYNRLGDLYRAGDYTLSQQYYNRAAWLRQNHPAPRVSSTAPTAAAPPAGGAPPAAMSVQMAGPGRLMRSPTWIDGRPTYILESSQAQVLAYLAPQAGVDLERSVGQNVEVLGQLVPRADVRGPYMTVARVRPLSSP